jgi:hypothetical protein
VHENPIDKKTTHPAYAAGMPNEKPKYRCKAQNLSQNVNLLAL